MSINVSTYIEQHEDDSNNLLLVEVVQNFGHALNDAELVVREVLDGEGVEGQDPKGARHVVGDLAILRAVLQQGLHQEETLAVAEVSRELVGLDHVHQGGSEGRLREVSRLLPILAVIFNENILLVEQIQHEISCCLSTLFELVGFDEHGINMSCEVTVELLVVLVALDQETIEDADAVKCFVLVVRTLERRQHLDARPLVLDDSVDEGECVVSHVSVALDVGHDAKQHSHQINEPWRVRELALLRFVEALELFVDLKRTLR